MPSGGVTPSGGGGGPAAGSYLPVANKTGVTVDTTTYNDTVAGGGAKLATLVFPDTQGAFALAKSGDAFPRWVLESTAVASGGGMFFGDGTGDPTQGFGCGIATDGSTLQLTPAGSVVQVVGSYLLIGGDAPGALYAPRLRQLSPKFTITSGALPTVTLSSGTGAQISTARDAETVTPVTFNPGAATTATCKVELSPDDVTYSTLGTETEPAGVAFDGTIHLIKVRVPAGWYLKLTVTNATLGTTTYY